MNGSQRHTAQIQYHQGVFVGCHFISSVGSALWQVVFQRLDGAFLKEEVQLRPQMTSSLCLNRNKSHLELEDPWKTKNQQKRSNQMSIEQDL